MTYKNSKRRNKPVTSTEDMTEYSLIDLRRNNTDDDIRRTLICLTL